VLPFAVLASAAADGADVAAGWLMAVASLVALWGVYVVARECFDATTGWVAALLFVLSGSILVFSRNYKLEMAPMWCWLLAGLWAYLRSRRDARPGWLWLSGGLLGYAFTCHYATLVPLSLVPLFELAWPRSAGQLFAQRVGRVSRLVCGMLLPALGFQLMSLAVQQAWPTFITYWSSIARLLGDQFRHEPQTADPWYYLYFLWRLDGPVLLAWSVGGLGVLGWMAWRQRSFAAALVVGLIAVPLMLLSWSTQTTFTVPRSMAPVLPLTVISAAAGVLAAARSDFNEEAAALSFQGYTCHATGAGCGA
jgi:4-amino-4-deoxy-L-arabinose transferase-like glycosyltransferase